jgi:hypothetical protein
VICPICQSDVTVLLHHTQRIGKRLVEWDECSVCFVRAERLAAQMRQEVVAQRTEMVPPTRPKKASSQPFIEQLEPQE